MKNDTDWDTPTFEIVDSCLYQSDSRRVSPPTEYSYDILSTEKVVPVDGEWRVFSTRSAEGREGSDSSFPLSSSLIVISGLGRRPDRVGSVYLRIPIIWRLQSCNWNISLFPCVWWFMPLSWLTIRVNSTCYHHFLPAGHRHAMHCMIVTQFTKTRHWARAAGPPHSTEHRVNSLKLEYSVKTKSSQREVKQSLRNERLRVRGGKNVVEGQVEGEVRPLEQLVNCVMSSLDHHQNECNLSCSVTLINSPIQSRQSGDSGLSGLVTSLGI